MSFLIRGARENDLPRLLDLARQFSLLSLPNDKKVIAEKIEISEASFAGKLANEDSVFLFVIEDLDEKKIAGSSQVKGKKGTSKEPCYSFQLLKKERFSKTLGVGFIHQILRLKVNEDGPSELGGLVVDTSYRRRPEKIGKLVSLSRFNFIGRSQEKFENNLLAEMAPPLTDEGRSEFWESLGRRFTGMPYQEADLLSQKSKEFIRSLFPEEDIYLALLDSKARLVMGRVGPETLPALHLLESIGFKYIDEVDPFDGGPHYSCPTQEVSLVKKSTYKTLGAGRGSGLAGLALVSSIVDGHYRAVGVAYESHGQEVFLPDKAHKILEIDPGDEVYITPIEDF